MPGTRWLGPLVLSVANVYHTGLPCRSGGPATVVVGPFVLPRDFAARRFGSQFIGVTGLFQRAVRGDRSSEHFWGMTLDPNLLIDLLLFGAPQGNGAPGSTLMIQLLPFVAIGFLFYFLLIRPQRQEHARRKAMLAAIKKNDHVITAGGIYGVVTNVRPEDDEVTVKVDEANNTKLRMTLSSISRVLQREASDDTSNK